MAKTILKDATVVFDLDGTRIGEMRGGVDERSRHFRRGQARPRAPQRVIAAAGGHSAARSWIGDSEVDVRTANAAALPIVFVRFGYGEAPLDLPSDAVIDHFDALGAHAVRLLQALAEHPADL
ncbi:MAG: hypothetical protein ACR2J1_06455 [Methyloceanibacter sp.]|uniref:hypothetical protein n=1 Tax=Methyloceanibacter sp. TaxID=1965321 RepID=UPI003D9BBAD2